MGYGTEIGFILYLVYDFANDSDVGNPICRERSTKSELTGTMLIQDGLVA
jgi:hypothetical protein